MMAKTLVLHQDTSTRIAATVEQQPHALLIQGPAGIGKSIIAQSIAAQLLSKSLDRLADHPYVLQLWPSESASISIEAIRALDHFLSRKVASRAGVARMIIIHDAHTMTTEAQNALLKTLEEPPLDTVLLLTSADNQALLPTILSRLQQLEVKKPLASDLQQALLEQSDRKSSEIARIISLSAGLPGLAFALAEQHTDHPLVIATDTARQLLQQSTFERLCQVEQLAKNKQAGRNVLFILKQMADAALVTGRGTQRWQRVLKATYTAEAAIQSGTQPKLALTELMLSL